WKSLYPTQMIQIAYVNTDKGPCILFQDDMFEKIMNDGTVRSSTGIVLRGLEVISRNNNIVSFCVHETMDKTTHYMGDDEDGFEPLIENERNSYAYFNRYKTVKDY
ncbi:MAG: hypothetical protein MJ184_11335, partial [Treponema sp.]|uniref:hypothetical protein n=1 Tax=Treponema sp. TaxID=166 RepID=UPI00298DE261